MMQSTGEFFQTFFMECLENEPFRNRFRALLLEHDEAVLEPTIAELYNRIKQQDQAIAQLRAGHKRTSVQTFE